MAVKKRCPFCRQKLRPDGTCANPECPLYVPESEPQEQTEEQTNETNNE